MSMHETKEAPVLQEQGEGNTKNPGQVLVEAHATGCLDDTATHDLPALLLEELVQLEASMACEGWNHPKGSDGHDDGPARYMIINSCPRCEKRAVFAMCAGRVSEVLAREAAGRRLVCSECGLKAGASTLWTSVVALNGLAVAR